ncbi:class I ribonucleotide reductase maintenance protein YfaE [Alteromonas sp. ASW11-36]|uniref:Class I ribonucleotide reductase maintenance protein YfaE n=1 Tax=Alteromonas arenosi TaxID=3055817 RepID=A0ABT7SX69_9ALTE|nr:class I ribonucleotide reductase maintenance protein YfaE [Alteromonas sp. ASW11-36]MDM7860785.1 class I ribonucleotide reductase maintenance protein YfaE [Alteromonas sp. ASW11-36]
MVVTDANDGEPLTLRPSAKASILEALEIAQVEVQYHCRDGFCGACRCKIIEGSVDYFTDPLAFIDDDEILPCCSRPSSNIKIEIPK